MKFHLALISLLLIYYHGFTQDLLPFIENFSKSEYRGDNQIWSISMGNDHSMYFASNRFLLQYNGASWRQYLLPYKTIIRSVLCDENRIYTGSYNEFGFWLEKQGQLKYHSLSSGRSFFTGLSANEEIWKIFRHNGKVYFQSFNEMYEFDPEKNNIRKIKFPAQVTFCHIIENEILVPTVNSGTYIFDGNNFIRIKAWDGLNIIQALSEYNGDYYIFTKKDGVFKGNKSFIKTWDHPVNRTLKSSLILSAVISQDKIIAGTSASGAYIIDLKNGLVNNINKENRLQNNTVLSVFIDPEKNLWLGLDNGISHIEINSPFRFFTDPGGLLGTVYTIVKHNDGYIIGSNHGVFTLTKGKLSLIPGSEGQVWDLYKNGNEIIIGHNDGTFLYRDNKLKKLNSINGGWNFFKSEVDSCFYQTNYSGIAVYRDLSKPDKFKILPQITKPLKTIVQNKKGTLFVADNYRGMYKIDLDENQNIKHIKNLSEENNIINDFDAQLVKIRDRVIVFINGQWYESSDEKLVSSTELNEKFSGIDEIIPVNDTSLLILNKGMLSYVRFAGTDISQQIIPRKYYFGRFVNKYSRASLQGNYLLLNLDDGFMMFDTRAFQKSERKIWLRIFRDEIIVDKDRILPYRSDLDIEVLSDNYGYNKPEIFYSYQKQDKLNPVLNGHIFFNKLSSGKHFIDIFIYENGKAKRVYSQSLQIAKPWYLSSVMILLYLIFFGFILYLYYRWNHIRFHEKLKIKNEELKHQKKIFELELASQNAINAKELEKHLLEIQVQNKASEVAVKSLSLAKHGEMIANIEEILKTEKNIDIQKARIRKIIKIASLDENAWKSFEDDLIRSNRDFVERLLHRYQNLSSKDLKLCIYLRMNLSSKEIAPLMNISFRGVELHRYRLRKKMGIGTDINLNNHMLGI